MRHEPSLRVGDAIFFKPIDKPIDPDGGFYLIPNGNSYKTIDTSSYCIVTEIIDNEKYKIEWHGHDAEYLIAYDTIKIESFDNIVKDIGRIVPKIICEFRKKLNDKQG